MHIAHLQKRITAMKTLLDVSTPVTDNRLAVDDEDDEQQLGLSLKKSMQVVDDHPLSTSKSADSVFSDGPNIENSITSSYQLRREIDSVCIDWRSLRNIKECVCSTPFDHSSKKVSHYFLFSHFSKPIHQSSTDRLTHTDTQNLCIYHIHTVTLLAMRGSVLYKMSGQANSPTGPRYSSAGACLPSML